MSEYRICLLKKEFYERYPSDVFKEILQKGESRPYLVLLLEIGGKLYALPFRSNINHKYCFKIKNDRGLREGIDYSKALVVDEGDVGRPAHLRAGTKPEIDDHIEIIIRDFKKYLNLYQMVKDGKKKGRIAQSILSMTTLKYFG